MADKPDRTYDLIVNGRQKTVSAKKQSFEDIVILAFGEVKLEQFNYTVTYIKGEGGHEGDLVRGDSVTVKDEMTFNVRRSDKS